MAKRSEEISRLLEEWENIKNHLNQLFQERDTKNASKWMEKGIGLFEQFLLWTNEGALTPNDSIPNHQLTYKPVNIDERLAFIKARPALYHSYRQLSELMVEQEKLFAKKNIVKKNV
ncbi:hypothetical protein BABA_09096 [Neobacillus bataviensis LMG 21833]|uniref:YpoC-like domain-containing protein n=1 Tax=Neobacillus bataviensis LMG 21833 TaxID=1117379 RepID=K6CEM2_9BACI|nr:hypothetical protein [Neobacillus bataviensis]EKN69570.1 hypothetical protein BABA_09096 [Neobacillus bataviensis LMG 21833]